MSNKSLEKSTFPMTVLSLVCCLTAPHAISQSVSKQPIETEAQRLKTVRTLINQETSRRLVGDPDGKPKIAAAFCEGSLTNTASTEGDVIDAGAGDDQIDGMGGNDVLEGGDGIFKAGFMNTAKAQFHEVNFVDGGAIDLIASNANYSRATGQFHCGNLPVLVNLAWDRHRSKRPGLGGCLAANDTNFRSVA